MGLNLCVAAAQQAVMGPPVRGSGDHHVLPDVHHRYVHGAVP